MRFKIGIIAIMAMFMVALAGNASGQPTTNDSTTQVSNSPPVAENANVVALTPAEKYEQAVQTLKDLGLKVDSFGTYEEAIGKAVYIGNHVPNKGSGWQSWLGWAISILLAILGAVSLFLKKKKSG